MQDMSSVQERRELNEKARSREPAMPGGMGGTSFDAQENLAEGKSRGGQTRKEQIGTDQGYKEVGRKGGFSNPEETGGARAAGTGINID